MTKNVHKNRGLEHVVFYRRTTFLLAFDTINKYFILAIKTRWEDNGFMGGESMFSEVDILPAQEREKDTEILS